MNQTKIRKACDLDREELIAMMLSLQEHIEDSNPRIWHLTEKGKQRLRLSIDEMLSDEGSLLIVAEEKEEIIGFAYGRIKHRDDYITHIVGFIRLVYVKKDHRRRGIGTHLISELYDFFEKGEAEEANLNYILENREAEEFWKGLGFRPVRVSANTPLKTLNKRLLKKTYN